jgi:diaminopimelate epimerase
LRSEHGYVETIFGRKATSRDQRQGATRERAFFERAAINAPIQGTAADIIRRAMIRMTARAGIGFDQMITVETSPAGVGRLHAHPQSRRQRGRRLRQRHALRRPAPDGRKRASDSAFTIETNAGILIASEHADGRRGSASTWASRVCRWDEIPLAEEFHDTTRHRIADRPDRRSGAAHAERRQYRQSARRSSGSTDLDAYDLERVGPLLENHPIFPEKRQHLARPCALGRAIEIRKVWERGVGLTKGLRHGGLRGRLRRPRRARPAASVTVHLPGGPLIGIEWREATTASS